MKRRHFLHRLAMDQAGEIDEKRVLGIISFVLGDSFALVGSIWAMGINRIDWIAPVLAVAGFLAGSGLVSLGAAIAGDQGRLSPPVEEDTKPNQ